MQNFRPFPPCIFQQMHGNHSRRTDMPQNGYGWLDGPRDPCTGGKRVFRASDGRTDGRRTEDGQMDGRTDRQPENLMPTAPKGGGITIQQKPLHGHVPAQQPVGPGSNLVFKLNCHATQAVTSSFLRKTQTLETGHTWIICRSRAQQQCLPC